MRTPSSPSTSTSSPCRSTAPPRGPRTGQRADGRAARSGPARARRADAARAASCRAARSARGGRRRAAPCRAEHSRSGPPPPPPRAAAARPISPSPRTSGEPALDRDHVPDREPGQRISRQGTAGDHDRERRTTTPARGGAAGARTVELGRAQRGHRHRRARELDRELDRRRARGRHRVDQRPHLARRRRCPRSRRRARAPRSRARRRSAGAAHRARRGPRAGAGSSARTGRDDAASTNGSPPIRTSASGGVRIERRVTRPGLDDAEHAHPHGSSREPLDPCAERARLRSSARSPTRPLPPARSMRRRRSNGNGEKFGPLVGTGTLLSYIGPPEVQPCKIADLATGSRSRPW